MVRLWKTHPSTSSSHTIPRLPRVPHVGATCHGYLGCSGKTSTTGYQCCIELVISHDFTIELTDNKTVAIHFNRKLHYAEPSLFLENRVINFKLNSKFLGIILDKKLNWKAHIQKFKSDCMKRLGILRCISHTDWGAVMWIEWLCSVCIEHLYALN